MGISTHILDTAAGRPAAHVPVSLARWQGCEWTVLSPAELRTDADGRARALLSESIPLDAGLYRVRFETAAYFREQGCVGLYPWVEITFEVHTWTTDEVPHYHIPLLLTANGYTTYRGS
ncbi:MAG: hydroxyisourate hydrolase [Acidobacteriota bacterium]|nr:hydroxyisourate hydrolase [Acidobacteriota bacterium]